MSSEAAELAHRLARHAEAVCRYYLSNGRRHGRYWMVGDVPIRRGAASTSGSTAPTTARALPANGPNMLRRALCCAGAIERRLAGD